MPFVWREFPSGWWLPSRMNRVVFAPAVLEKSKGFDAYLILPSLPQCDGCCAGGGIGNHLRMYGSYVWNVPLKGLDNCAVYVAF
jgi:hypothetical protein